MLFGIPLLNSKSRYREREVTKSVSTAAIRYATSPLTRFNRPQTIGIAAYPRIHPIKTENRKEKMNAPSLIAWAKLKKARSV